MSFLEKMKAKKCNLHTCVYDWRAHACVLAGGYCCSNAGTHITVLHLESASTTLCNLILTAVITMMCVRL